MADKNIQCVDCKQEFVFTEGEQKFYQDKGFSTPKRCQECRSIKKQKNNKAGNDKGWDKNEENNW